MEKKKPAKKSKKEKLLAIAMMLILTAAFTVLAGGLIKILAASSAFYEIENNGTNTGGVVGADAGASGGQFLQFTDAGDNWQFTTNMSSIGIWVIRSLFGTTFDVYVNGTYFGNFNTYDQTGTTYKRELRLFNFLDGNNHTVIINHTGVINPSGQKNLDLDAFIINSTAIIDLREAEDDWSNKSGTYLTENENASSDAILQLPDASSYFQTWGSGKYLFIYTKNSLLSTFYNVTYNGLKFSFDTYYNGYLYKQKNVILINSTHNNSLLTINNSGINNTLNNSLVDLDYIIFYPFDRPVNSTVNISSNINDTHLNVSWSSSDAESGRTLTYHVIAAAFENSTSIRIANTTDVNMTLDMSSRPHDFYKFKIEANDDYLESFSPETDKLLYFDYKGRNQRASDAAYYLVTSQKGDGSIPDYFDGEFYNSDNTAGYSAISLYLAWKNLSNVTFIDSLGEYLDWFAGLQDENGSWHYAYKYNSSSQSYYPDVWDYYKNLNITDIKVVDAIQSYYSYGLWMYSASGRNSTKVSNLTSVAELGMKKLISDNYDGSRFFYSSNQYKNSTDSWTLLETKYAAGQVDVFLGMLALWNLTQNVTYLQYADDIKSNFDSYYWNSSLGRYSISLDSNDAQEPSTEYLFAQGYAPSVFGTSLSNGLNAYDYLKTRENADGSINSSSSLSQNETANSNTGDTLISAMTILASRKLNQGRTENLSNYLRKMQVDTELNSSGGMKFDKSISSLSVTTVDFGSPALFSDNLPLPDLKFKNAANRSVNFRRYENFTANITIEYVSLDNYIFSTNASGSWVNKTVDISGIQSNASEQANITLGRGNTICWYYWTNDTSAESRRSETYCFAVSNTLPSFNETISDRSATVGDVLSFQANCSDVDEDTITYYDNTSLFDINSSSGEISDISVSSETGSYAINITCSDGTANASQTFIYTIDAALSTSPGGNNGGGGGGGGSSRKIKPVRECSVSNDCPRNQYCVDYRCVKIFDLKTLQVDSPLQPGELLDFTYLIKGMANISGDVALSFWLESYDDGEKQKFTGQRLAEGSDVVFIGDFEEKIESTNIFLPSGIPTGRYILFIKLAYDGYEVLSSRVIEIKTETLLRPSVTLITLPEVSPYEGFNYSLILSVNKDVPEYVELNQRIIKDGEIYWFKKEDLLVNHSRIISSIVEGLDPGDYVLELEAKAGGQVSTSAQSFSIGPAEKSKLQEIKDILFSDRRIKGIPPIALYIIFFFALASLSLAIIFLIRKTFSKKKADKNAVSKITRKTRKKIKKKR